MRFRFTPDWIVLPAVAAVTAVCCLIGLEVGARVLLPQQILEPCQTATGASRGGCSFRLKTAEGPWTTVSFNACGSRSIHPCDAIPADDRVVVLGSSITRGYGVSYEDMFSARAEAALDHDCAAPVEFQELSLRWPLSPRDDAWSDVRTAARAAIALHPKLVLLFVTQWDMYEYSDATPAASGQAPKATNPIWKIHDRVQGLIDAQMKRVRDDSRFVLGMRTFLSRDDQEDVKIYHSAGDMSDFLKPALTPVWNTRVDMVARFAEPIAEKAAEAGVPFAVVYIPPEPPVLLARGFAKEPADDPFALSRSLQREMSDHGMGFIDTLPAFAAPGAPRSQFYRVNGHPNAAGHAAIARALTETLARDDRFCRSSAAPAGPAAAPMLKPTPVATPAKWSPGS
jgi:hypothetical protein